MKVILQQDVRGQGKKGQMIDAAEGYARNYLLPQAKALRSNKENLALFEARKVQLEAANLKRKEEA